MKVYRSQEGPFAERPYYTLSEIDAIGSDELRKVDLFPSTPSAIRIERFIEKRFNIQVIYDVLPDGILGFTRFGSKGVEQIVISRTLAEEGGKAAERRLSATLAHEAGHGLLHAHLFVLDVGQIRSLFGDEISQTAPKVLSREGTVVGSRGFTRKGYSGHWWEFQANQAIGSLLMPRSLVQKAVEGLTHERGSFGQRVLEQSRAAEAVSLLSETFDVNPAVAQIRVEDMFGPATRQLTL